MGASAAVRSLKSGIKCTDAAARYLNLSLVSCNERSFRGQNVDSNL